MAMNTFHTEESTIKETDIVYHERLGFGSDGEVYRITWMSEDGDTEAAAKKIKLPSDETRLQQLRFEIQVAQNFNHDNVIKYYGHVITDTHVIIVMEYAAKGTLFRYLQALRKKNPRVHLSSQQIRTWAKQAAEGIQYFRTAGIVHRDVKSPNLLIMADGTLKLCDFGLAKYLHGTETTNKGRGTARWLAPEVWKEHKLSPKADVFAFGIVLWELISGDEPYEGMRPEHVVFSVAYGNKRPDIPARCPDVYKSLMKQCWEDDRNKRPTIEEIVTRLDGTDEIFGFPPAAPRKPEISSSGSTKLRVTWESPDDVGESPIIGYELEYKVVNSENGWVKVGKDLITKTSYTISGLKTGTKYETRVTAVNKAGHGPQSQPVTTVTVGKYLLSLILSHLLNEEFSILVFGNRRRRRNTR
ncbi:mitogen-activated protein kinase kinase kinase 20-like [Amphiura filiformis]|uniref:mitogen-activated protein kinase kinase kinase 20-like n=1 Tax=Amphiura filiformis TaxID=82378 RepID=UPI003B21E148